MRVGVLLEESEGLGLGDLGNGDFGNDLENDLEDDLELLELDDTGHMPAAGRRGRHAAGSGGGAGARVVEIGEGVLRAAAEAVGREVAVVVSGVVGGIDGAPGTPGVTAALDTGSFDIGELELKFGVKAVLGAGKAVEALLTASGEATVEVTLKLQKRPASPNA